MRLLRPAIFGLGLYVCLAASIVHRHDASWMGVDFPWGLALAVGATYLIAVATERLIRAGSVWFMLGWVAGLVLPMLAPGSSYLIAQDWLGTTFMLAGVGSLAVATLRAPRLSG